MNQSRSAILVSSLVSKVQLIIGAVLAFVFGLTFLMSIFVPELRDGTLAVVSFIFMAGGVWLLRAGSKRGRMIKLFKSYVARLSSDPTRSIDSLAASLGESPDAVKRNLEYMIKRNYFSQAYIDVSNNTLVLSQPSQSKMVPPPTAVSQAQPTEQPVTEFSTASCKGCGATNTVPKNTVATCEFCGSQLTA